MILAYMEAICWIQLNLLLRKANPKSCARPMRQNQERGGQETHQSFSICVVVAPHSGLTAHKTTYIAHLYIKLAWEIPKPLLEPLHFLWWHHTQMLQKYKRTEKKMDIMLRSDDIFPTFESRYKTIDYILRCKFRCKIMQVIHTRVWHTFYFLSFHSMT